MEVTATGLARRLGSFLGCVFVSWPSVLRDHAVFFIVTDNFTQHPGRAGGSPFPILQLHMGYTFCSASAVSAVTFELGRSPTAAGRSVFLTASCGV